MINYARFTSEQIELMAAHGATAELRDRAKAEQLIRQQEQENFDLRRELAAANARIVALEDTLRPFAAMNRPDCDLSEVACMRGTASDLTLITSSDFRKAADALGDDLEDLANNMPDEFGD